MTPAYPRRKNEPERLTEGEHAERLAIVAEMWRIREGAIADGLELWDEEQFDAYMAELRAPRAL